ncbi:MULTISPECIES: hypothetical protein [Actinomycetes]|uniref:DUF3311 domain-containing protein n=2 Tax=Actinomycetes TaxID=1760 RepID=A0ABP6M2X9_9MICC|nr:MULTISPECIES: hypothetical protein [unclassified Nesterenkonia]MDS2172460.1 hypothetical protein [Nesterenkonia sp. CL21]OSM44489.1 hypothetical protein BCY76_001990 [Nesterenkonia sp. PF2B19]
MKEPIRRPWIWVVLAALVLFNAPWYLPEGSIAPYWFGIPYWVVVVLVLSAGLSAFLTWVCLTQWHIVEDEEEADTHG